VNVTHLLQSRLLLVTGKGGTGKTTLSAALARLLADRGKRVCIVEIDSYRPALTAPLGVVPGYHPVSAGPRLDACNIVWRDALMEWLADTVPAERVVRALLTNKVVQPFLEATPGLRETVVLSKVLKLVDAYDVVVVDMPASGHTISLLGVPRVAVSLMRTGPIRERALAILDRLHRPDTALVIVALPEEMVVNETIELWERLRKEVPTLRMPVVALNRAAVPSLSEGERTLLERLAAAEAELPPEAAELLLAGRWEASLEAGTTDALRRLEAALPAEVVRFARLGALGGGAGGPQRVVQQMVAALQRHALKEAGR
jgi:anion-transporting  ArsA/GET3 family ATPase